MKKRHPLHPSRLGHALLRDWKRKLISLAIAALMLVWLEQYGKGDVTFTYRIEFEPLRSVPTEELESNATAEGGDEAAYEGSEPSRRPIRPSGVLTVLFDERDYCLADRNPKALRSQTVEVKFHGVERNLPRAGGTAPPLEAICRVEERDGSLVLVLDADTIRHHSYSSVHRDLEISIEPEERRIEVVERKSMDVRMEARHVGLDSNADRRIDPDQLDWSRARFTPETAKLNGPAPLLERIRQGEVAFRFQPDLIQPQERVPDVIRGRVEPIDWRLQVAEPIRLSVPRQLPNREILLHEVPVVLYQSKDSAEQYEPRNDRVNVPIRAFGLLKTRLEEMSEPERMRWVAENAMLVARVPSDAREADVITNPRLLLGTDFREGTDFELTVPLTVDFKQKNP